MSQNPQLGPRGGFAPLVPEYAVTNIARSLHFWCVGCGFAIAYQRRESHFAFLEREGAQVMLEQVNGHWQTGAFEHPLGRGINVQIGVTAVAPVLASLAALGWPLYQGLYDAWYRMDRVEVGCRQFLVQDPDGYLLRFSESLGQRPIPG